MKNKRVLKRLFWIIKVLFWIELLPSCCWLFCLWTDTISWFLGSIYTQELLRRISSKQPEMRTGWRKGGFASGSNNRTVGRPKNLEGANSNTRRFEGEGLAYNPVQRFLLEVGEGGKKHPLPQRYRRPCRNALVTYASVASPTVCLKK